MRQKDSNTAVYFTLVVEVVCKLENYTLIRFAGRNAIVKTEDLVFVRSASQVA
jgi:hypothetical protein